MFNMNKKEHPTCVLNKIILYMFWKGLYFGSKYYTKGLDVSSVQAFLARQVSSSIYASSMTILWFLCTTMESVIPKDMK